MFHEYRDEVTALKTSNAHFAKIFDEHNELDDRIKKIEDGEELMNDMELEGAHFVSLVGRLTCGIHAVCDISVPKRRAVTT